MEVTSACVIDALSAPEGSGLFHLYRADLRVIVAILTHRGVESSP